MNDVAILMGSGSDWPTMQTAAEAFEEFRISCRANVVSAHRMPEEVAAFERSTHEQGFKVVITRVGGTAHLPRMLATLTPLPVIGVPVALRHFDGMDSLLSIVQVPVGVPIVMAAVSNARNAGLLAVRILAAGSEELRTQMVQFQTNLHNTTHTKGEVVRRTSSGS